MLRYIRNRFAVALVIIRVHPSNAFCVIHAGKHILAPITIIQLVLIVIDIVSRFFL